MQQVRALASCRHTSLHGGVYTVHRHATATSMHAYHNCIAARQLLPPRALCVKAVQVAQAAVASASSKYIQMGGPHRSFLYGYHGVEGARRRGCAAALDAAP